MHTYPGLLSLISSIILCDFSLLRAALLQGKAEELEDDCLGRLGVEEPGSQPWVSRQGFLCSLWRIALAPLMVSPSNTPPYSAVLQGPNGTDPGGCNTQLPSPHRWGN